MGLATRGRLRANYHLAYVVLSEFDISQGSVCEHSDGALVIRSIPPFQCAGRLYASPHADHRHYLAT
jgi:hypothetical protein